MPPFYCRFLHKIEDRVRQVSGQSILHRGINEKGAINTLEHSTTYFKNRNKTHFFSQGFLHGLSIPL